MTKNIRLHYAKINARKIIGSVLTDVKKGKMSVNQGYEHLTEMLDDVLGVVSES